MNFLVEQPSTVCANFFDIMVQKESKFKNSIAQNGLIFKIVHRKSIIQTKSITECASFYFVKSIDDICKNTFI